MNTKSAISIWIFQQNFYRLFLIPLIRALLWFLLLYTQFGVSHLSSEKRNDKTR